MSKEVPLKCSKYIIKTLIELHNKLMIIRDIDTESMICHPESVTVLPDHCTTAPCNETCLYFMCKLCWDCLSQDQKYDVQVAYREQKSSGDMKRVFPAPGVS